MLLCTCARQIKSLACAAASESIVDWRGENENMQHKALNPQPQDEIVLPHRGQLTMPVLQTAFSCLPLSLKYKTAWSNLWTRAKS